MIKSRLYLYFWYLAIAAASLFLRLLVQPYPLFDAGHDDSLLVGLAHNILQGNWLGDWQLNSLSKGPGYSLFLAAVHPINLPVTLIIHALILLFCFLVVQELLKYLHDSRFRSLGLYLFAFAAFFPVFFGRSISRIYREGLLALLALIVCYLVMVLWRRLRTDYSTQKSRLLNNLITGSISICLGLTLGFYYISKVNWQFLAVLIGVLVFAKIANPLRVGIKEFLTRVFPSLLVIIAVLGSAAAPITIVLMQNKQRYGVFMVDDFSQGSYPVAAAQIMRVVDLKRPEYVDVTHDMRSQIYAISPTFKKLEPFLEIPDGTGWRTNSCKTLGICNESAAWFWWDIRDAAFQAGLASTPVQFQETFRTIANDISAACEEGSLDCGAPGIAPGIRSLDNLSPRLIIDAIGHGINHVLNFSSGDFNRPGIAPSSPEVMEIWQETVNNYGNISADTSIWNPGSRNVEGVLATLNSIYKILWPLLIVFAGVTLFVPFKQKNRSLQVFTLVTFISTSLFIAQIALLEADGGLYLLQGANLYLIPIYPLMIVGVFAAILRGLNNFTVQNSQVPR